MKTRKGRPPKPTEDRKKRYLQVRVTEAEKNAFDRAAEIAHIDVSAWVRERLCALARKELAAMGEKPDL